MAKKLTVSLFVAFLLVAGGRVSAQTITSNGTGGGNWNATSTWQGGAVPTSANSVVIAGTDSVFTVTGVADSCNSITIQTNGKFKNGDSTGFKVMTAFTIQSGGYYFNGNNTTSWPTTGTYTIDPASNYVQTANASSTIGASGNSTYGNLTILKNGTAAGASLTINGNLVINTGAAGNPFKGSTSSTGSLTHNVVGNVTVISGQWSAVDVGTAATTCIWNIGGNVTVGDPSASAASRIGPFSSGTSVGIAIFNIAGNLSLINGARLQGGSSSTAGTGTGIINLKGNFSIDNTCSQNTSNKIGALAINFVGTSNQNVNLGIPLAGLAYSAYDTVATGATVTFAAGSRYWGLGGTGSPTGAFVVNGTLNLGVDTLKGTQNFVLNSGATLGTSNAYGFDTTLAVTGTKTLSTGANYTYNGSVNQVTGTTLPDTVNTLTAATVDTLSFTDSLAASNVNVSSGATLLINQKVKAVQMSVSGLVIAADTLSVSDTATFNSGSVYDHAMNAGSLPSGKWNSGSTLEITGVTNKQPSNGNQNFYNVIWNCPGQTSNLNMGWNGITVGGNISVVNTGTGRWQLCGPSTDSTATVRINGDVNVSGGQFTTNGTGNGNTTIIIDDYGNVNVTGGNFSISRGSQGGTGTSIWNLHSGNFSMSNATTQNSNTGGIAKFLFSKQGTQTLVLGPGNTLTTLPLEVSSGTTLDLDTNVVAGSGIFTVDSGATIITRLAAGFNGNLTNTGAVTLSKKANFTYNGKVAQITGTFLPDTVNNLTISDSNGVVLTKPTVINGVLTLKAGLFNNLIPFVLGPGGSIVYAGGRLLLPYNLSVVTIAVAREDTNHDLIPDNLGDTLKVFGIVTSPNMGSTYTSYYIQDSTAGIDVYTGAGVMNFQMGDSVFVIGSIKQNRGLTEISPLAADSAHFGYLKHNAKIPTPKRITLHQYVVSPESYEGSLIEVDSLYKASGIWGSGSSVYLMNISHADTTQMYINANTNVGSAAERQYPVNVVGIASQYSSGPTVYNNGYQIIPRDSSDIVHITIVGVDNAVNGIPKDFYISQNYPNPFNPTTTIKFGLPKASPVQIVIYNILGQRVMVLVDGKMEAGNHVVMFDGTRFASGVYFYVMQAGDKVFKQKMLLLK